MTDQLSYESLSINNRKLLGKNLISEINDVLLEKTDSFLRVACIGLYNQGKSSLLNAIIGDFNEKTFKVSDKKETTTNKEICINDVIYIDTPGLNAEYSDDSAAMIAIKKSDLYVFVHKISGGALTSPEEQILRKIHSIQMNDSEFLNKFIFVLTNIEGKSEEEIKKIESIYSQQLEKLFSNVPAIVSVATSSYTKAMREGKKLLAQKSNYDLLNNELNNKISLQRKNLKETKKKLLKLKAAELISTLNNYIKNLEKKSEEYVSLQQDYERDVKKYRALTRKL